jgi:glycosyltransferase involved in cell wall biosynthesis
MRTGFRYALRHGYDIVVQVDADGQHDPREVTELLDALDTADLVIGARFAGRGSYPARGPRRWAMWVLALALSRMAGTRLTDVTSGFRAAGPRAVRLFAHHYPAEYLGDTVESLVNAARCGLRVRQVPVQMRVRQSGNPSQTPIRAAVYLLRAALALLLVLVRRRPSLGPSESV